jgi:hypothetical protein
MYGYPEQFIPNEEYPGGGAGWGNQPAFGATAPAPVTQMRGEGPPPLATDPSQA